jgi:hypothetical protein
MSELDEKINASLQKNFGEWVFKNLSPDQMVEFNKNMEAFMNDVFAATAEDSAEHHNELYDKSHIAGMNAPTVFHELVDILYPVGHAHRGAFLDNVDLYRDAVLRSEYEQLLNKQYLSISGAMRWEFSQEAPLWSTVKLVNTDHATKYNKE